MFFSDNGVHIEDFHYDTYIGDMILNNIKKTQFEGMKGVIEFDEFGGSMSTVTMQQMYHPGKALPQLSVNRR